MWKQWKTKSTICGNSRISTKNVENKSERLFWKVESMEIKICILNNAIASNFVSVDGRDKMLTKDSAVYWSSLLPGKNLSFQLKAASGGLKTLD